MKTYTVILGLANSIVDEKGKTMCEFASHMDLNDPFITSVVEGLRAKGERVIVPEPVVRRTMPRFIQDGYSFYESKNGAVIASYPKLVKDDHDMEGATKAREQFLKEFPDYKVAP